MCLLVDILPVYYVPGLCPSLLVLACVRACVRKCVRMCVVSCLGTNKRKQYDFMYQALPSILTFNIEKNPNFTCINQTKFFAKLRVSVKIKLAQRQNLM